MSLTVLPKRKRPESSMCVCSHPYGDHLAKEPHACKEEHQQKPGHRCACLGFQLPAGRVPTIEFQGSDRTLEAARSGATIALQHIVEGLPSNDDDGTMFS